MKQTIDELIGQVPDYQRFLTVDEMTASSHQLASNYPDLVEIIQLGHSRAGYPMEAIKIGNGSRTGMMVGLPHPNEPIGAMMLEFFLEKLVEDETLRTELDMTWYIIKCVDPDGTKLNEGWFNGPFTITNYARNFYRPPGEQQVEWTFPLDYKTYSFHSPLPETQAWMKLLEEHPPDFIYSLHNAGFGGVYLYLSHDIPDLYPPFYELVDKVELPLHLGEPEVPFIQQFDKAVFGMISMREQYDYMDENIEGDPADTLTTGAGSYEYASQFGNPTFLVCEMPYFYNASIHDTSLSDAIRRDLVLDAIKEERRKLDFMKHWLEKLDLRAESAFRDAVTMNVKAIPSYLMARENQAKNDPEMERNATVAEKFDNQYVSRFYYVLMMGVFLRMLETEIAVSGETPALAEALQAAKAEFDAETTLLEENMNYSAIPIRKLVQVQLGTALLLLLGKSLS